MDFNQVKNQDEVILWQSKPSFLAYFFRDLAALVGLVLWVLILASLPWSTAGVSELSDLRLEGMYADDPTLTEEEVGLRTGIFALVLTLFTFPMALVLIIILFAPLNNLLNYFDEAYAITDQRIIMSKGALRTNISSLYYGDIQNLQVSINPVENWLGVGTVKIYTGEIGFAGGWAKIGKDWLVGVQQPETAYKILKERATNLSKVELF